LGSIGGLGLEKHIPEVNLDSRFGNPEPIGNLFVRGTFAQDIKDGFFSFG
jgi:hypothetical protein